MKTKIKVGDYVHVYGNVFGRAESPDGVSFFSYGHLAQVTDAFWKDNITVQFIKGKKNSTRVEMLGVEGMVHPFQLRKLKNQKRKLK